MHKNYSFKIKTVGVSSSDICNTINNWPEKEEGTHCYNHDGSHIFISTAQNPKRLKFLIESKTDIELENWEDVVK